MRISLRHSHNIQIKFNTKHFDISIDSIIHFYLLRLLSMPSDLPISAPRVDLFSRDLVDRFRRLPTYVPEVYLRGCLSIRESIVSNVLEMLLIICTTKASNINLYSTWSNMLLDQMYGQESRFYNLINR